MNLCDLCDVILLLSGSASFTALTSAASFSDGGTTSSPNEAGVCFRTFFRTDSSVNNCAVFSSSPVANFLFRASLLFASAPPPRKHNTGWKAAASSELSLYMFMFRIARINQWPLCPPVGVKFLLSIKAGHQKTFPNMLPLTKL